VQVGDPFTEKLLLEACLELMAEDAIVAIQDMGAAGLTSSTFEMAGRGDTGLKLDLDRVPLREPGLTPYEMMLSESQERMVLVAQRGREEELVRVYRKWGLEIAVIGEVTDTGRAVLTWRGRRSRHPIKPLTDEAPVYHRPVAGRLTSLPAGRPQCRSRRTACAALSAPAHHSRIRQQALDLGATTRRCAPTPCRDRAATRLSLLKNPSALALTCDVNPVYCYLDLGAEAWAVAEAVRNLATTGAEPVGLSTASTSPRAPRISWQFRSRSAGCLRLPRARHLGERLLLQRDGARSIRPRP
jgi:phosphoribosylformylglycinamidine synthase